EFRHVRDHVVDAEYGQGMWIGGYDQARDLRSNVRAPGIRIREKESLTVSPAVIALVVERLALLLERDLQSGQRETNSTVVRRVFPLRQQAILLHALAGIGNGLGVLVGDALAALVIFLGIVRGPPVAQIALGIELAALIVESMNDLVPDHHSDGTVIHGVVF